MLRQYFNCNERLEIFLTCFCNTLCYVGDRIYYKRPPDKKKRINAKLITTCQK